MGKLILCSGERTARPYVFAETGDRVYSIEELCYFLYQNPFMVEEELFDDALIDWIGMELKLPQRSEKLRQLKEQKADAKTMATVVLCSSDYYTEQEIKGLLRILDEISGMPRIKRSCVKAGNYLAGQQYSEAGAEYEKILATQEAAALSPVEYGDILHNLAIVKLYTASLKEAAGLFARAYERNRREESLRQFLYALALSGDEELYLQKLEEYQVSGELRQSVEEFLRSKREEAGYSGRLEELEELRSLKESGQIGGFYQKAEEMLKGWKREVRRNGIG